MSILGTSLTIAGVQTTATSRSLNIDSEKPTDKRAESSFRADGTLNADLSKVTESGKAAAAEAKAEESSEPPHIKQLREQIKQLQKQLAEQQKQLKEIQASKIDDDAKAVQLTTIVSAISSTSAALQEATALLLQELTKSGGSSAGGSVSTTA